tara:strand:- start:441 stop:932 length:492 start_codon:yes stop_codon:yes gene_type:complete
MRFLNCIYGLLNFGIVSKHVSHVALLNTRIITPLFSDNITPFYYGSKDRRDFKNEMGIRFLVQDHHCIPYQFRNHKLLRLTKFNVNSARNIVMMPNKKGFEQLNLHKDTLIHDGGHAKYNSYVGKHLQRILNEPDLDVKRYKLWLFLHYLKDNLKYKGVLPWN